MPRWLHNMLMGAAYMFGHRNPLVSEILERSDEDALASDFQGITFPEFEYFPVKIKMKYVGRLPWRDYEADDDSH